jgi:hypothetical protein
VLWWPTSCVSYATNKTGTQDWDPADTRLVIKRAFEAWTDVPCADAASARMTFQELEPVDCKRSQYDKGGPNVNVVLFQDDDWSYPSIDGTIAKTSVTYNDETGEIYDADIQVNTAFNTVTMTDEPMKVEYDLQSILTHEVGHFIGLAHSPDPAAVMFATYRPGSLTGRELTPDDVSAVCAVYPHDYPYACRTSPRGGFSPVCPNAANANAKKSPLCAVRPGAGPSAGTLALALGAGVLALRGRRRSRPRARSLAE